MKTKLPPLPKIGERRLLKLIEFLEVLPPKKFEFRNIVQESVDECGTVCCAIGWTPALFPKLVHWVFTESEPGRLTISQGIDGAANLLFGMDYDTSTNLFIPDWQKDTHPSLPVCGADATPKQVAKMLRKYLSLTKEAA